MKSCGAESYWWKVRETEKVLSYLYVCDYSTLLPTHQQTQPAHTTILDMINFLIDYNSGKWKYRFIALKIGEEQGANLEVYKIKKNDDVVFSFHIELGGGKCSD